MSKIITTNNGDAYKTPGFWTTTGGVLAGSTVAGLIKSPLELGSKNLIKNMQKTSQSINNAELRNGIADAFESSGLAKKGVKIIDAETPKTIFGRFATLNGKYKSSNGALREAIDAELPKWLKKTTFGKVYGNVIENTIANGYNAAFLPKPNKIVVNIDKLGASTFHEMGHAINRNMSKFWSAVQKTRGPLMLLSGVFTTTALLKRKKAEGEEPKNAFDKVTTFIKNNVGPLVTLSFVPMIAEELKATQRGNQMAKKFLSAEAFKNVKKCNRFGAASYIAMAVLSGVGAFAASKVRDAIAKPKEVNVIS